MSLHRKMKTLFMFLHNNHSTAAITNGKIKH